MPSRNRYRSTAFAAKNATKFANQSAKYAGHFADSAGKYASKAITGLARWATTDHTGTTKLLANLPPVGFIDTIGIVLVTVVTALLGAVSSGAMLFLLIAYGIPALLFM